MNASYFRHLAKYNIWANARLFAACGSLPADVYLKKRPSYFGSIHKTLNHLLVADMIWIDRFVGKVGAPKELDKLLFDDFRGLFVARQEQDEIILDYTISLTEQVVDGILEYTDLAGVPHDVPLFICLGHFFNHQTHHRGQVHGLLSQEMDEPPPLDMMYYTLEAVEGSGRKK